MNIPRILLPANTLRVAAATTLMMFSASSCSKEENPSDTTFEAYDTVIYPPGHDFWSKANNNCDTVEFNKY